MSQAVIHVEGLGKRYRIGERERYLVLRDLLANALRAPVRLLRSAGSSAKNHQPQHIWALKDVSFEVNEGEVVGIIGRNGAGKTTLLKILARITRPTEGFAEVRGRMGSLLEVGTGFHPELTGRENVYLSGAILGMKKKEIERKFDEIVAFAEVEKFIDTPLKYYSSGMQVRLAFAVAAHLEPEILLVDEVLAVGDLAFQKKCLGKMGEVARRGRTVLFVSHNLGAVTRLCQTCFWLDEGRLVQGGRAAEVVNRYQSHYLTACPEWTRSAANGSKSDCEVLRVAVTGEDERPKSLFAGNEPVCVAIRYLVRRPLSGCQIGIRIQNSEGVVILTTTDADGTNLSALPKAPGVYSAEFTIPGGFLPPGLYSILVAAHLPQRVHYDLIEQAVVFEVSPAGSLSSIDGRLGVVSPLLRWQTVKEAQI